MDKQDELARAVQEILPRVHILVSDGLYREASEQIAAAVHAYANREDVVEADAFLVEWTRNGEHWVEAHADQIRAVDQALRHRGICTPLYRMQINVL